MAGNFDQLLFGGGAAAASTGLDQAEVQALIDASEDVLTGQYVGQAATFAALPLVDANSNAAVAGDWAVLTQEDGVNEKGIYRYDGAVFTFETSLGETAKDRLFADDTTVSPITSGEPTIAEISTFAGSNINVLVYYNGTDVPLTSPTHVYHIDNSGNVTLLEKPVVEYSKAIDVITTSTTLTADHDVILASGAISITLPAATIDKPYTITNTGTDVVTIIGTVSGVVNPTLPTQYQSVELAPDGTSWFKI